MPGEWLPTDVLKAFFDHSLCMHRNGLQFGGDLLRRVNIEEGGA